MLCGTIHLYDQCPVEPIAQTKLIRHREENCDRLKTLVGISMSWKGQTDWVLTWQKVTDTHDTTVWLTVVTSRNRLLHKLHSTEANLNIVTIHFTACIWEDYCSIIQYRLPITIRPPRLHLTCHHINLVSLTTYLSYLQSSYNQST